MKKCVDPSENPSNWEKCHVVVEAFCDTLKVARKKAQDFNYSEAESIEINLGKGKRKITKKQFGDSSSDEEQEMNRTLSLAPQMLDIEDVLVIPFNELSQQEVADNSETIDNSINQNNITVVKDNHSDLLRKILTTLSEIKLQNIEIREAILQNQTSGNSINRENFQRLEIALPIKDLQDLEEFYQKFESDDDLKLIRGYIRSIGGLGPKDYIHRVLQRFYTNKLAACCSWLGLRNNKKMEGTLIINILEDVIFSIYQNMTKKEFEHICSEWFRHANQRLKREKQ